MKFSLSALKKIHPLYYVIIGLFIIVLYMSNYAGSYVPYQKMNLFSKEYPYEGFISDYPENIHEANVLQKQEIKKDTNGVLGFFNKLQGAPISTGSETSIDVLSTLPGSPDCVGISSGYSKSLGGICLDESTKTLLTTRGMNQSG
jgi:hypothetical protein